MGQVQLDFQQSSGAVDLNFSTGPEFASPYTVLNVLFQRQRGDPIDIILSVCYAGRLYTIDKIVSTTENYYVFPNARVPNPMSMDPRAKIVFATNGTISALEDQTVLVQWSQY
jgi:hypothetical protein